MFAFMDDQSTIGEADASGWWGTGRHVDWSDAVEAVRGVSDALGLELQPRAAALAPWHPGRCAELLVEGVVVGHAGELHPRVCTAFGLPPRSVAAEVDLDLLLERAVDLRPAPVFSTYPVAKEDVALVVDADVPAASVEAALRESHAKLEFVVESTVDQTREDRRTSPVVKPTEAV